MLFSALRCDHLVHEVAQGRLELGIVLRLQHSIVEESLGFVIQLDLFIRSQADPLQVVALAGIIAANGDTRSRAVGKLEDLLEHAEPSEDWIRAELTDKELIPYALERLRMSYPNVMELVYLYQEEQIAASNTEVKLVPEQSLVELLGGFLDSVYQYQLEEEPEAYQLMEEICKEAEQEK